MLTGLVPNYIVRNVIEQLQVGCLGCRYDDGSERRIYDNCHWKGLLRDYKDHEYVCEYKEIDCNINGCDYTCKRKDMGLHQLRHEMISMQKEHEKKIELETNHTRYMADIQHWEENHPSRWPGHLAPIAVYPVRNHKISWNWYNGGAPLEKVVELLREGELVDEEHVMNTTMIKYVST